MSELVELKAPDGKFRVVGVDTFSGTDWVQGDFPTKEEAIKVASKKAATMTKMHIYDDHGRHIYHAGTF
jgi:hypothetical protein